MEAELREDAATVRYLKTDLVGPTPLADRLHRKHKGATVGTSPIKAHSIAMLLRLYPGLMWKHLLKHPWRYGSQLLFGKLGEEVGQYGDRATESGLKVLQRAGE